MRLWCGGFPISRTVQLGVTGDVLEGYEDMHAALDFKDTLLLWL
jgi:hypothetical protein